MAKPILICHPGRCGSHWLLNMLKALTGLETLPQEPETIPPEGTIMGTRKQLVVLEPIRNWVYEIFLLRDPRDVETSMRLYDHIVPGHFTQEADAILEDLGWYRWFLEQKHAWRIVRYEELWLEPLGTLHHLLSTMGYLKSIDDIREVIRIESFERRTGRKPGEEDVTHHLRKGIIGDWVNHWSEEKHTAFMAKFSKEMRQLGY